MKSEKLQSKIQSYDWILLFSVLGLLTTGLLSIFSTTQAYPIYFYKQLVWVVFGFVLFGIFSSLDYRLFKVHFSPVLVLYSISILGLVAVDLFGTSIRGSKSWIALGPFNIEPVEILKVVLVLIFAKYFSMRHVEMYRLRHIIISGVYVLIPAVLVLIQPDLGSFLVLFSIWIGVLLVSGIKSKHFAILCIVGVLIALLSWSFLLLDYQKTRILSFLNPEADPYGAGYNSIQAKIAVASGGFLGKGLTQGTQSQLGFLPEAHTDFIYAAVSEELGVILALTILTLYGIIFWRMMLILVNARDNFARLTVLGFSVMLSTHVILNISVTLGLVPVTGLSLPFVSYGGSNLLSMFIALGIIQSIHKRPVKL